MKKINAKTRTKNMKTRKRKTRKTKDKRIVNRKTKKMIGGGFFDFSWFTNWFNKKNKPNDTTQQKRPPIVGVELVDMKPNLNLWDKGLPTNISDTNLYPVFDETLFNPLNTLNKPKAQDESDFSPTENEKPKKRKRRWFTTRKTPTDSPRVVRL